MGEGFSFHTQITEWLQYSRINEKLKSHFKAIINYENDQEKINSIKMKEMSEKKKIKDKEKIKKVNCCFKVTLKCLFKNQLLKRNKDIYYLINMKQDETI